MRKSGPSERAIELDGVYDWNFSKGLRKLLPAKMGWVCISISAANTVLILDIGSRIPLRTCRNAV